MTMTKYHEGQEVVVAKEKRRSDGKIFQRNWCTAKIVREAKSEPGKWLVAFYNWRSRRVRNRPHSASSNVKARRPRYPVLDRL